MRRLVLVVSSGLFALLPAAPAQETPPGDPLGRTSIGMRLRLTEKVIPGGKLRAKKVADPQKADAIVRVLNVFPHGQGFRYNLEVTPLVPGRLDLRSFLEREDGQALAGVPPLPIEVEAVLPADRLKPNPLQSASTEWVGGYVLTLIGLGALWVIGLFVILFAGRRRRIEAAAAEAARPLTLADRLRPLVEAAQQGQLDAAGQAALERLLVAHWRQRRGLDGVRVGDAIQRLRRDEEAGPLLQRLELWLHAPPGASSGDDIGALLEPYRHVPDMQESA